MLARSGTEREILSVNKSLIAHNSFIIAHFPLENGWGLEFFDFGKVVNAVGVFLEGEAIGGGVVEQRVVGG